MADLCNSRTSHRERDTNYNDVIYVRGRWRVIVCKDDAQWIIQYCTCAESPDRARWRGRQYLTERDVLIQRWSSLTGDDGDVLRGMLPRLFRARR